MIRRPRSFRPVGRRTFTFLYECFQKSLCPGLSSPRPLVLAIACGPTPVAEAPPPGRTPRRCGGRPSVVALALRRAARRTADHGRDRERRRWAPAPRARRADAPRCSSAFSPARPCLFGQTFAGVEQVRALVADVHRCDRGTAVHRHRLRGRARLEAHHNRGHPRDAYPGPSSWDGRWRRLTPRPAPAPHRQAAPASYSPGARRGHGARAARARRDHELRPGRRRRSARGHRRDRSARADVRRRPGLRGHGRRRGRRGAAARRRRRGRQALSRTRRGRRRLARRAPDARRGTPTPGAPARRSPSPARSKRGRPDS